MCFSAGGGIGLQHCAVTDDGSASPHRRTRSLRRRGSSLGLRGVAGNALGQQGFRCVMRYLADSSALWRLLRDPNVRAGWTDVISDHAIGSCQPQRIEFRRSARNLDEYEQMTSMFVDLFADVPVPKTAWQWVESAQ
jgi:hypothetical protein